MRISELSVRRPVFATVLSMMLVIFGLVSLQRLSVREYPDIDRPTVTVTVAYRGASAAIIETKITQIIEDSVAGIEGILKLGRTHLHRQPLNLAGASARGGVEPCRQRLFRRRQVQRV